MNWVDKAQTCWLKNVNWRPMKVLTCRLPCTGALLFWVWRRYAWARSSIRDEPLVAAVCTEQEAGYTNDPAYLLAVDRAPLALSSHRQSAGTGSARRGGARLLGAWYAALATSTRVCFPMIRQKSLRVSATRKPTSRFLRRHRPIARRDTCYLRGKAGARTGVEPRLRF